VTAEPIAAVVADIRAGRASRLVDSPTANSLATERAQKPQPVVDASALYQELHHKVFGKHEGIYLYDDYPSAAPPWDDALISYVNEHGNVIVLAMHAQPWLHSQRWKTSNAVDWFRLKWLIETFVWVGGRSLRGGDLPTTGPCHLIQHAVYPNGEPADIHWVKLDQQDDPDAFEVPMMVLCSALNFLACTNVDVAEPTRPRPVRRRLARTGVTVQTIVVRPPGKRRARAGDARQVDALDTPLSSVRGHFARYGEAFGRGKLFGKLEGKFWIPAHARGAGDGFEQKDYVLKPAKENAR
jgi:hypothetical protein